MRHLLVFIDEVLADIFLLVSDASLLLESQVFHKSRTETLKLELTTLTVRDDWQPYLRPQIVVALGKSL